MALALGNAVSASAYLPGSMINGSLEQRMGNRSQHCVFASDSTSSMATHGSGKMSKRVAEDNRAASLRSVVEKAKSLWWTPLVGTSVEEFWSNMPDVKEATESAEEQVGRIAPPTPAVASVSVPLQDVVESAVEDMRSRKVAVTFTPEKARALRKSLRDSKTWHDGWYHSAIASRLAEESH